MNETGDASIDEAFVILQREYLADAPARLADLHKDLAAFRMGEPDALESLRRRFHQLAGSGGSYGFPRVTEISRAMEHRMLTPPPLLGTDADLIEQAIQDLRSAFDQAAVDFAEPVPMGKLPGFAYRTLLMMPASPLRKELVELLCEAGFVVDSREHEVEPWDLSPSERPDLVVFGTDITSDPLARVRFWSSATADRPRAVVIADQDDRLDRLRTAAAGVDAVFGRSSLPMGLVQYAKALAHIGAPPATVLVVEDDPAQAQLLATWLEQINARVRICNSAQMARDSLATDTPDLVLLDVDLPDIDGYAVARLMRQDPRLALVPVVFLTARQSLGDEMEGLRAGGDDFLAKPVERSLLLQVVLTRTERGRRIRELVHRDSLTGASNHATLMAELEHAIAFSGRHGEPLCFLMLDLDHFKRINDTYGHMVGDQVLQHVAGVFRRAIRGSDLLGRYGGEEFGIILRRCPPANGRQIAEKLRDGLEGNPLVLSAEDIISPRVSIGIATFPGSGKSASEVAMAADRAMYRAKSSGRDRIEMA